MREQASAGLYNEENSVDNQHDDENFSVLTAQGLNFFGLLFATSIHKIRVGSYHLSRHRTKLAARGSCKSSSDRIEK
jgi:hypothetical protein